MKQLATPDLSHRRARTLDVHIGRKVSAKSVHAELEKILTGKAFVQSERLKRFLRLAVEEGLQGRGRQFKEYLIGVEVFDRHHSYDPRTDPIVRVEAHRLRSKLDEYYRTEGLEDQVVIDLPKGTYAPVFRKREPEASGPELNLSKLTSPGNCTTIAVLPFADLSRENDQEHFCCAIAEALIAALTQLDGLRVVSRTPSFRFKSLSHDIQWSDRKLDVFMVLKGSVQKAGKKVRVTAQLIEVANGYYLWSESYDRQVNDVLAIQDEISRGIVNTLRLKLAGQQEVGLFKRPTENLGDGPTPNVGFVQQGSRDWKSEVCG
jgi:adenylate cyclase